MGKPSVPSNSQIYERPRLPFWLRALLTGVVPISILLVLDYQFAPFNLVDTLPDVLLILSLFASYLLFATRFASRKLENLTKYAESMTSVNNIMLTKGSGQRTVLGTLLIWLSFIGMFILIAGFPSANDIFVEHVPTIAYFLLILSFFIWSYADSMYAIYKLGKLPLQLKPYTEDRTLGLRPFGVTSLQLTSAYVAFPLVLVLLSLAAGTLQLTDIILVTSMTIVGGLLFFLPLLSFREKLRQAKRKELSWIVPWHTRVVQRLKDEPTMSSGSGGADKEAIAQELQMVRSIHQDIRQIQNWPFDTSILSRLITILVLPPFLGVMARLLVLLFLRI